MTRSGSRERKETPIKHTASLRRKILNRNASMAVVGQGYVGLTLAAVAAEAGFEVTGMDIDEPRIDGLSSGVLVVPGVNEQVFEAGVNSSKLTFSSDPDS